MTAPADTDGWLVKDAGGCGGWHIRRLTDQPGEAPPEASHGHHYYQREVQGVPMSATFVANGSDACVLGFNELIMRRFGARPFVFCGAVGPVLLPAEVTRRITAAVRSLAAMFSLRGLGSLDFMLDGEEFNVLEVNPRPPASIALYGKRLFQGASRGVVASHVRACLHGELPELPPHPADIGVEGTEIVFAPRSLWLDDDGARRLGERAGCHDLPPAAARFGAGDPVCSVSAGAASAEQVRSLLARGREAVIQLLETHP